MKAAIREKRKLTFEGKVITPESIRRLAAIIDEQAKKARSKDSDSIYLLYSVDATDSSSYESQSIEIFNPDEITEKKSIQRVNMRFNTVDNSKSIEIQILHSKTKTTDNFVSVSGDDPTWVNGIMSRFSETLSLTKSRSKSGSEYESLVWIFMAILCTQYIIFIVPLDMDFGEYTGLAFSLMVIIPFSFLGFGFWLREYISLLWPSVELQTGPNYLQIPKLKRKKVRWVLASVVLPLILALLYDWVKRALPL